MPIVSRGNVLRSDSFNALTPEVTNVLWELRASCLVAGREDRKMRDMFGDLGYFARHGILILEIIIAIEIPTCEQATYRVLEAF